MSIDVSAYIMMQGQKFSPKTLEDDTEAPLREKIELGELRTNGRYKGQPSLFGAAFYDLTLSGAREDLIPIDGPQWKVVRDLVDAAARHGSDLIVLHFDIGYQNQCNFELGARMLEALSALGIPVTFTCYEA